MSTFARTGAEDAIEAWTSCGNLSLMKVQTRKRGTPVRGSTREVRTRHT